MAGTFQQRTAVLLRRVGEGKIEASVRVDQVYAQNQHQSAHFKHPNGGGAFYLANPLKENAATYLQWVARDMFNEPMRRIFKDVAIDLNIHVKNNAPQFMSELGWSGEPRVKESGKFVFRGPHVKRLTKTQLRIKSRLWHARYGGHS